MNALIFNGRSRFLHLGSSCSLAALWLLFGTGDVTLGQESNGDVLVARLNSEEEYEPFDLQLIQYPDGFWDQYDLIHDSYVSQASMLQQTPLQVPRNTAPSENATSERSSALSNSLFGSSEVDRSLLRQAQLGGRGTANDYVSGLESAGTAASDVGSLLGKSNRSSSVSIQKRNPVVSDPRVRSSRIGSLAASGSHWVPTRVDLDTVLSKFDSRQLNDAIVIPGPYSSIYGPGFQFVEFDLERSPRYSGGTQLHGRSSADFKSNGGQAFGQQTLLAGSDDWGLMATYGHRSGSDYLSGDNTQVPSSYKSGDFRLAYGEDFENGRSLEFSMLQLNQNDIELPGYAFNIDDLNTQGYELELTDRESEIADRAETAVWYNRTTLNGTPGANSFLNFNPILPVSTDVDSMSTGYRHGWMWKSGDGRSVATAGQDMRFIKQELNEISVSLLNPAIARNSPIPNSFSVNPGVYAEYQSLLIDDLTLRTGGRIDFAQTDIVADRTDLDLIGSSQNTFEAIVGTNQSQRDFFLASFHTGLDQRLTDEVSAIINTGYAERLPTLTELYAAQPFVQLVQNGLNNITGDPTLSKEKLIQVDLGLNFQSDAIRSGIRGFHGWYFDYITFENTSRNGGQVDLRAVNTDLATMAGAESFMDLFPNDPVTPFMTLRYVDGRDRTRDGNFATVNATAFAASFKDFNRVRGAESNTGGASSEPLPGISPLETRLGARLHDTTAMQRWSIDLVARVNARQNRVASSLLETPTSGFTVYDLRGSLRPLNRRNVLIVGGVENFTDKQYQEHLDYRNLINGNSVFQPGINFYLGTDLYY